MIKRILDVGNCGPDHASISQLICANFDAVVHQTHGLDDTLTALQETKYDLVLVNRKLDRDDSDGIDIIRQIIAMPDSAELPVMLVTNFEDHQSRAIESGAVRGFGKLTLASNETVENLRQYLA